VATNRATDNGAKMDVPEAPATTTTTTATKIHISVA